MVGPTWSEYHVATVMVTGQGQPLQGVRDFAMLECSHPPRTYTVQLLTQIPYS